MKSGIKKSKVPPAGGTRIPVSMSFGSVTVHVTQPPESVRRTNIEAGQAALKRGKDALLKPGVKLIRQKGIPLYFGCEDRPGWMVRELDGKKTIGRFANGRFLPEKAVTPAKKRGTKN